MSTNTIPFPTTGEAKVRMIAKQMGVSYNDALTFCEAVAFWMGKGLPFELAVQKHTQTMRDGCALMLAGV
jgi:hypothetical protein